MLDWEAVNLFMMILSRMSGFVLFNPMLGRRGVPGVVKAGLVLLLTVTVFYMSPPAPAVPGVLLQLLLMLLLEMAVGYFLGLVVNIFFYIPIMAGEIIDTQMGMSMGKTYDPGSQASLSVTATLLNVLMTMLFFAANGHHTLLRIFLLSGDAIPFGMVSLGTALYSTIVELFIHCTILSIKLCMPILAAELLGQVGMGILMKAIPQINVFAINIELKVIIGLSLVLIFMVPFSEYLLEAEAAMLQSLQRLLPLMGP